MPVASGSGGVKYWLQDHDTDIVTEGPPVLNQWYPVFDAEDVRLLWCAILQSNDEAAAKDVEVRWTIDGQVYLVIDTLASGVFDYIYRWFIPSTGGTTGLMNSATMINAGGYVDKRGLSFKVEVRIVSAPGTSQILICECVRETLEQTAP